MGRERGIRNNTLQTGREHSGRWEVPSDTAEHAAHHTMSAKVSCRPRPQGTPASADCLLELQQSQPNPNTFSALHTPSEATALCAEKPDPRGEIKVSFK